MHWVSTLIANWFYLYTAFLRLLHTNLSHLPVGEDKNICTIYILILGPPEICLDVEFLYREKVHDYMEKKGRR